jgi:cytochrome c-type biogenesis protein CcmH/NrfF
LLWATPLVVFAVAALVAAYGYRRRRDAVAASTPPLDAAEQEALHRLASDAPVERKITES